MSSKTANVVDSLDAMLSEIGAAAEKQAAEANTEPGGYQGGSSHPSTSVDDRTGDAQEGSRSSENTSDVKADQGALGVDSTSPGTPGGQDSVTLNIGTNAKATGEDSSNETSSAKGGKEDPGTQRGSSSHPARTDNDSLDGHKYAALIEKAGKLETIGRDLIAAIAVNADGEVQKRAQQQLETPSEAAPATNEATKDTEETGVVTDDVVAKQAQIVDVLAHTVQDAFDMADKTAAYLQHLDAAGKAAAESDPTQPDEEQDSSSSGESEEPSDSSSEAAADESGSESAPEEGGGMPFGGGEPAPEEGGGPPPEMGGGMPPEGGGGAPGEDELLQALAGGGDIGAEGALGGMTGGAPPEGGEVPGMGGGMPPEGGGMPPEGGGMPPMGGGPEMGGMPPEGGGMPPMGGGMPPMGGGPEMGGMPGMEGGAPGMGGEPGMGGPSEEDLMILEQALQAVGISPEEFEAAIASKAAQAVSQRKREKAAGKAEASWKPKTAAQAARYQETMKFVQEVIGK